MYVNHFIEEYQYLPCGPQDNDPQGCTLHILFTSTAWIHPLYETGWKVVTSNHVTCFKHCCGSENHTFLHLLGLLVDLLQQTSKKEFILDGLTLNLQQNIHIHSEHRFTSGTPVILVCFRKLPLKTKTHDVTTTLVTTTVLV